MINIANRLWSRDLNQEWGQRHKFIDPCMCSEFVVSGDPNEPNEAYDETIDHIIERLKALFAGSYPSNEDEWCWIFLPYNIEYDFQTFNYTKLYMYMYIYFGYFKH